MAYKKLLAKLRYLPSNIFNFINFKRKHVVSGKNVTVKGTVFVTGHGQIILSDNVRINSCQVANPIGGDSKTVLNTCKNGLISIGENSGISNCALVAREKIEIGKNVKIGGSTQIFDNDFHSLNIDFRNSKDDTDILCSAVTIKDGSFIGARCIILKGVTIGCNCVVGAGSVVTKSIPDNQIWAGNPARFIREI